AVVAMVAIGEGARAEVDSSFGRMGSNVLVVTSGTGRTRGVRSGSGALPTLTWDDLQEIRTELPSLRLGAPPLRTAAQGLTNQLNWGTQIEGVSPEYFDIRSWNVSEGELFSAADLQAATKVAVLGQTVADKLFGEGAKVIDNTVRIGNLPFRVVGLAEAKGQSASATDYDDLVFRPPTTFSPTIHAGIPTFIP